MLENAEGQAGSSMQNSIGEGNMTIISKYSCGSKISNLKIGSIFAFLKIDSQFSTISPLISPFLNFL